MARARPARPHPPRPPSSLPAPLSTPPVIEIKATAALTARHVMPLDRFRHAAGEAAADHGLLVCRVKDPRPLPGGNFALPWRRLPAWLEEGSAG